MKKLTFIALTLALVATSSYAGWWKTYGGEGYDMGNCVQITSDNNYAISGQKDGNLWFFKTDTSGKVLWEHTYGVSEARISRWFEETSDGGYVIAASTPSLLKTDAQGDTLWTHDYGIKSYCVQQTPDSGYIVVGGTNGYGWDEQLVVVKTNPDGDSVWTHTYAEPGHDRNVGYFIQVTSDGGYIITGLTGINEWEMTTLWLVKLDSEGNIVWTRSYGSEDLGRTSWGRCVHELDGGGYIVTGFGNPPCAPWLLKTDANGDTLWAKTYDAFILWDSYNVQLLEDGGYIMTGTTESVLSYTCLAERDLWLIKTDPQGDTIWSRLYGDVGVSEIGYCVQQTEDGGYIATGVRGGDLYLLRTDTLGLLCVEERPRADSTSSWGILTLVGSDIALWFENRPCGFQASVYNVSGRMIDCMVTSAPSGVLRWGQNHPPGIYFIRVHGKNDARTVKVVLIR